MPASWRGFNFKDVFEAIAEVGRGTRRVDGTGWRVYRTGATIRVDLQPLWLDPPEPEMPSQAHLDEMVEAGQAEAEAEAMYHEQLAMERGEAMREREGPHDE